MGIGGRTSPMSWSSGYHSLVVGWTLTIHALPCVVLGAVPHSACRRLDFNHPRTAVRGIGSGPTPLVVGWTLTIHALPCVVLGAVPHSACRRLDFNHPRTAVRGIGPQPHCVHSGSGRE